MGHDGGGAKEGRFASVGRHRSANEGSVVASEPRGTGRGVALSRADEMCQSRVTPLLACLSPASGQENKGTFSVGRHGGNTKRHHTVFAMLPSLPGGPSVIL